MITTLIAAAMLANAADTINPSAPVTIYVDYRKDCGIGRIGQSARERTEKTARNVAKDLKKQGRSVTIVKILPGMVLRERPVAIIDPRC